MHDTRSYLGKERLELVEKEKNQWRSNEELYLAEKQLGTTFEFGPQRRLKC